MKWKREVKNSTIYGDWNVNSSWINASWQRGEVEWEGERRGEGGREREGGKVTLSAKFFKYKKSNTVTVAH